VARPPEDRFGLEAKDSRALAKPSGAQQGSAQFPPPRIHLSGECGIESMPARRHVVDRCGDLVEIVLGSDDRGLIEHASADTCGAGTQSGDRPQDSDPEQSTEGCKESEGNRQEQHDARA
jgi:hypothetical protein